MQSARPGERTAGPPRVEVCEGDIRSLDIPAASVGKVHADGVLQHVPDAAAALAEARRVLRDGGRAVFATGAGFAVAKVTPITGSASRVGCRVQEILHNIPQSLA
jgi:ubiquinone/menaquinone biosynthesis C-methylase UbiE